MRNKQVMSIILLAGLITGCDADSYKEKQLIIKGVPLTCIAIEGQLRMRALSCNWSEYNKQKDALG